MTFQNIKTFYKIRSIKILLKYLTYNITLVSEGVQYSDATFIINKMILTISLVAICHHKMLWCNWLYSLCCTLHSCGLFYNWKFISHPPSPFSLILPAPLPSGNHQFSVSMNLVLFWIPYISEIIWCLSFSSWLNFIPSRSIYVVKNGKISFFCISK